MQTNLLQQDHVDVSKSAIKKIVDNIETVIKGKREAIELVVLAFIAQGHVLLEDLPGTGKTTLVSAMAKSVDCKFRRIQFTPDIMPSDVSGFSIFNQKTRDFEFRPGGVMSNLVLADEINRASAKTQAALLEAMEERQVTVDSNTYPLEEPFMVLATQNPIEQFGTYPLPEAQVDRFLIKLSMGYPAFEQEVEVIELGKRAKKAIKPVVSSEDILALRSLAERVHVSHMVVRYIVEIVTGTRNSPEVQVGSSPRGGIALTALTRAYALMQGRNYAVPDDVKYLAPYVLGHRISLSHEAKVQGRDEKDVIKSIISSIAVPYEDESQIPESQETLSNAANVQTEVGPSVTEQLSSVPSSSPDQTLAMPSTSVGKTSAMPSTFVGQTPAMSATSEGQAPAMPASAVQMAQTQVLEMPEHKEGHPSAQMTQSIGLQDAVQRQYRTSNAYQTAHAHHSPEEDEPIVAERDDDRIFEQFEGTEIDASILPAVSPLQETAEIPNVSEAPQEPLDAEKEKKKEESPRPRASKAERPAKERARTSRESDIKARAKAKPKAAKPMPSNDIAAQAMATANEKRSLFGRRKRSSEASSKEIERPIASEETGERIEEPRTERRAKDKNKEDSRIEKRVEVENASVEESAVANESIVAKSSRDEDSKKASRSATKVETSIPSTPEEVDVQAAFDAAFANLSFSTDDES